MNKSYFRFFDSIVVVDDNKNFLDKECLVNLKEILLQENRVETINNVICNDKSILKSYNAKLFNNKLSLLYELIFDVGFLIFLLFSLIFLNNVAVNVSLGFFGICSVTSLYSFISINNYQKKIVALEYKIHNSNKELKKELKILNELNNSEIEKNLDVIPDHDIIVVYDEKELKKVERNLQLGYLYKMRESIIKKKINEDKIDQYLSRIYLDRKKLSNDEKEIMLQHANKKVKVLKKTN